MTPTIVRFCSEARAVSGTSTCKRSVMLRSAFSLGRTAFSPLAAASQKAAGWITIPTRDMYTPHHPGRLTKKHDKRWWQPRLPALASEMCPNELGKGDRRKKNQQKRQQSITEAARRNEGIKRNKIRRFLRWTATKEKIQSVYLDYANILRERALAGPRPPSIE